MRSSYFLRKSVQNTTWKKPLIQSVLHLVMIKVLSVDRQVIFTATALIPSVMPVMKLATLPGTVPTRFLHQKCHARCHSRHWCTHNWRDRSHSYYGPRHRRQYSRSQFCPCSHCNRSSSIRRHTSHSSSSCCGSFCPPSASGCSCYPFSHDTNRQNHTPSCTCHFSCLPLMPLHRLELVTLQQTLAMLTRISAQES